MENIDLQGFINSIINDLNKVESEYNNLCSNDIYQLAIYLYFRCGEIPNELDSNKLLKLSEYIRKQETLFNEDINNYLEDIITE